MVKADEGRVYTSFRGWGGAGQAAEAQCIWYAMRGGAGEHADDVSLGEDLDWDADATGSQSPSDGHDSRDRRERERQRFASLGRQFEQGNAARLVKTEAAAGTRGRGAQSVDV